MDSDSIWRWRGAVVAASLAPVFSEVVAVLVCTALGIIALVTPGRNRWRMLAPLVASLLGLAIVALAPGNAVRSIEAARLGQVTGQHAIVPLLLDGARLSFDFLADWPLAASAALALLVSSQVSVQASSGSMRVAGGILLTTVVLVGAAALPMAWTGMSPLRAWNPVSLAVAIGLIAFALHGRATWSVVVFLGGVACGSQLWQAWVIQGGFPIFVGGWLIVGLVLIHWRKKLSMPAVTAALALGLLFGSSRCIEAVRDVFGRGPAYILAQQRRLDVIAENETGISIRVVQLEGDMPYLYHHADIDISEKTWQNMGQASFFDLKSIRAQPPALAPLSVPPRLPRCDSQHRPQPPP
jgi:hypothetical protein